MFMRKTLGIVTMVTTKVQRVGWKVFTGIMQSPEEENHG